MMKKIQRLLFIILGIVILLGQTNVVNAKEKQLNENYTVYWDDVANTGKDNGYSKSMPIKNGDPHYGWKLGKFALSGFSSKRIDDNGNYILLKNVGDDITLYFLLEQNINKLDNNKSLVINEDKNGYDNYFGVKKTNFGKGTLIIRKIDSTGNKNDPKIFKNYLKGVEVGANTKIDVFEEGDYEVSLDYEVRSNGFIFFKDYNNYKIHFNFSIRNGNSMIFPFDVKTKEELRNTSITENGFYLDLANSKYLNVNIKREVLKEGANGLVEDTRYNRPAKDEEEFTEEGIYTITVENVYTSEKTIKKIYVGKDKILKAHVQTGRSIENVREIVKLGATIDEEGNISYIPKEYRNDYKDISKKSFNLSLPVIISLIVVMLLFIIATILKNKNEKITEKEIKKKVLSKKNSPDLEEEFDEDSNKEES